ncbi:MAG: hypothetical protein JXA57_12510 [Armatimonadetes bacterium]|nr:hypothetical protein [Armatimonadota bacterium]
MTCKGDEEMYVMMVAKHSPESCPLFNKDNREIFQTVMQKYPDLLAKHGLKLVGSWMNFGTHTMYMVCDTPGMDAWMAVINEPGSALGLSFMTAEIFPVMSWDEAAAYMSAM